VLIVEDSDDNAQWLAWLLAAEGCNVRICGDGHCAIDEVRDFRPDVVLLDLGLKDGMSGHDVARAIRHEDSQRSPLIVAVTGWARETDCAEAIAAGCHLFFRKPADPAVLVDVALRGDQRVNWAGDHSIGTERQSTLSSFPP
jgi:CheY-like chemotaxis protein